MFYLRLFLAVSGVGLASIYGIVLSLLRRDRTAVPRDYARAMRRIVHPILGLDVRVEGKEHLTSRQPCVYVVNHQSTFDVPVLSGIYPAGTVLVAKKELRNIPLFGWLYEATGNILIDRGHNTSAVQRLREAEEAIRDRGVSVWMFPEGTRGRTSGKILPFKKGAFYLAIAAQVPIVPIVVSPVLELFNVSKRYLRGGSIQVRVLPPTPTEGLTDKDVSELMDRVHRRMGVVAGELRTIPAGKAVPRLSAGSMAS